MAGLTADGFERKRLENIVSDIEGALQATFGADIDLRPESIFGQLVGVLADPIAELWEEAENVLRTWLQTFPEDESAREMLEKVRAWRERSEGGGIEG